MGRRWMRGSISRARSKIVTISGELPFGVTPSVSHRSHGCRFTKSGAARQQIDAAIEAFHHGDFAASITLACAAEGMTLSKPDGLFEGMLSHPNRSVADRTAWIGRLDETRE
ncbi:hypothetical protein [Allomesorhizobium alhagi]|uniref:hypothetical protein n=1 Tax=Allomesorhizobium alhagi TaxID=475067 RepID=UPI00058AC009|nr:hypothetical protein [Mesorhizobium alhagi]